MTTTPLDTGALLSSTDVLVYVGGDITYRELDYWIRCEAIEPEVSGQGSGRPRWFTPEQAEWLRRIAVVRANAQDAGFLLSTEAIRSMWRACAGGWPWRLDLSL